MSILKRMAQMTIVGLAAVLLTSKTCLADPDAPAFREPVVLSSQDGVLEVTLTAAQGEGRLDTVAAPVEKMMLFSYELVRGQADNGQPVGKDLYPGPTLHVQPGDTLVIHLRNELLALSIDDFLDPAYTPVEQEVPKLPRILREAPVNLHTHGLHVSPMGNSDNVLLNLPGGSRTTYTFHIPEDQRQGLNWYHTHLHSLTTAETYGGLAGLLVVGRADGNLPAVTSAELPVRSMALQYNFVFDREGGLHQLNNPNWSQYVSTKEPPKPGELEAGTYEPCLGPVNIRDSAPGTRFVTNWYSGLLSADNRRGQVMAMPNNLLDFTSEAGGIPANPSLPDSQRDVQYTVNGQFQPEIHSKPGQTEIWVLANISDLAYMRVRLTETATGKHPPILIVGQDGLPYEKVLTPEDEAPTVLTIPPASRYAIAVTIPEEGDLVLEMPPATHLPPDHAKKQPFRDNAVAYTSRGKEPPTAILGTLNVKPEYISYWDGFFIFPTQVLLRAKGLGEAGTTVAFSPGQELEVPTPPSLGGIEPSVKRRLVINGGFLNDKASKQEPKAFIYAFDGRAFPNTVLIRSRLDSVEEWTFENYNNDEHPIHIHVNDFQVTHIVDPVTGYEAGLQNYWQDNVNVPAPLLSEAGKEVITPGLVSFRTRYEDFLGTFVIHCHRLNHEDNGLMAAVNLIPAVSTYAVAQNGSVQVRDGQGDKVLATVEPFPGYQGPLSLAMGDVNGDTVLDLVVGTGPGVPARVAVWSGAGKKPFSREITRFAPFEDDFMGGVNVAAGNIDGTSKLENIVVGSGPGRPSTVRVFSSVLAPPGKAPEVFSGFSPYPGQQEGVVVTVGMVEIGSGRNSVVTAPGPGQPAVVKVYRFDVESELCTPESGPRKIGEFRPFDDYHGGVTLASNWMSAAEGGAEMIVVGQQAAPGKVGVYSSGSYLDGYSSLSIESPLEHGGIEEFRSVLSFAPFGNGQGVNVATSSTTEGAWLLISGANPAGETEVRKYALTRRLPADTMLSAGTPTVVGSPSGPLGTVGGD